MEAAGKSSKGLPEWLEEFTENLEIVEMPAAANISHDSDPERPIKVHQGSTAFFLISRKTKIVRSARGPKSQGPRAEDEPVIQFLEIW